MSILHNLSVARKLPSNLVLFNATIVVMQDVLRRAPGLNLDKKVPILLLCQEIM